MMNDLETKEVEDINIDIVLFNADKALKDAIDLIPYGENGDNWSRACKAREDIIDLLTVLLGR
jgi:hypothetical protein